MLLGQAATEAEICGAGWEGSLLCQIVYRRTGNDVLARSADVIAVGLRVTLIAIVAYLVARLARSAVVRFSQLMERRIEARLARGEARGTLDGARYRSRRFQRLQAITGVLRGVASTIVWLIAILTMIDTVGISLQPVLAGAGLAGVVIGFGAQQLVRDVIAGIAMLIEDQYGVGDWVEIDGVIGQVERVGLRATSFRDLDGIQNHVLNGHVQRVGNLSQEWSRSLLDVPLALDSDVPTAKAIIHKVASELAEDPVWGADIIGAPEIWGVQDFGPSGLSIRVVIPTKPMANWDINRQMRERLHHAFERGRIRMPAELVELGGLATGYPLLQEQIDAGRREQRQYRREMAPPRIGPLDRPHRKPDPDEVTGDDPYAELTDRTTEMRIERGREPRPD